MSDNVKASFGLAHIKSDGAPVHPDEIDYDMPPGMYVKQAVAYMNFTKDFNAIFVRDYLIFPEMRKSNQPIKTHEGEPENE